MSKVIYKSTRAHVYVKREVLTPYEWLVKINRKLGLVLKQMNYVNR